MSTDSTTQTVDLNTVTSMLSRWYAAEIAELAQSIREDIVSGNYSDAETALHESVDGCGLVIYTHQARLVLAATDADPEDFELADRSPDNEMFWHQMAYCAVAADVRDWLERNVDGDWTVKPLKVPSADDVRGALLTVRDQLDDEVTEIDVRLQVYDNGTWALRSGSSDYDQDHRGYWGSGTVDADTDWAALAEDLIEQCLEQYAEEH